MQVQLVRNATVVVDAGGSRLLVDPMLDAKGVRPPVENTVPAWRNPLVDLPVAAGELVESVDGVLITHLHEDHLDATAVRLIADRMPVFCQPSDADALRRRGITGAVSVRRECWFRRLRIFRTSGRHGEGRLAEQLGPVSGFVIDDDTYRLYIAGDTIWCQEVCDAITEYRPNAVVVNAAGARFVDSGQLVMDADDVLALCATFPELPVIAVHLEAINHCHLTRRELRRATRGLRVVVPDDGDVVPLRRS